MSSPELPFVQRTSAHPVHDLLYFSVASALAWLLWTMPLPKIVLLAPATLGLMAWLLRMVTVTVDRQTVTIRFRTLGPTIPLTNVTEVSVEKYSFWRFGGWGIRISGSTTLYNVMGDGGQAVKIVWTTRNGHSRTILVSSRQPQVLVAAIERALAEQSPAPHVEG